jgi:hypothetical protein
LLELRDPQGVTQGLAAFFDRHAMARHPIKEYEPG